MSGYQGASGAAARILVRRTGALGDVLCTTPALRALRRSTGPAATIDVHTAHPVVLAGNPDVTRVRDAGAPVSGPQAYDFYLDLDLAYERRPRMHLVDAYLLEVLGDSLTAEPRLKQVVFEFDRTAGSEFASDAELSSTIVFHAARTWPNRSPTPQFWGALTQIVLDRGYRVIVVGSGQDLATRDTDRVRNLVNRGAGLGQIAALIHRSACFVTPDSGLLHLAGATEAPIVALFTCVKAEYRLPYRNGVLGQDVVAVTPHLDCYGCLADLPPPVTFCGCRRGDHACITGMDPHAVADAVERAIETGTLRGLQAG